MFLTFHFNIDILVHFNDNFQTILLMNFTTIVNYFNLTKALSLCLFEGLPCSSPFWFSLTGGFNFDFISTPAELNKFMPVGVISDPLDLQRLTYGLTNVLCVTAGHARSLSIGLFLLRDSIYIFLIFFSVDQCYCSFRISPLRYCMCMYPLNIDLWC